MTVIPILLNATKILIPRVLPSRSSKSGVPRAHRLSAGSALSFELFFRFLGEIMFGSMSYFELSRRTFSFALGLLLLLTSADQSNGDIVPISTSDAVGTGNRDSNSNFIGILDSAIPTTVTSLSVNTPGAPATEVFAIGDVVGRDVGAAGGDRTWEYVLDLPLSLIHI